MKIFLARQPILDKYQRLFGYELLYRNSETNCYSGIDGDVATMEVIRNSFLNIGINSVAQGKKVFINFTENTLKTDIITLMSPQDVVVEVLENIKPTEEILETCRKLKSLGYTIALDDFIFDDRYKKLIDIVDIIKIDFRKTPGIHRKWIMERVNSHRVKFLAEKVESLEEFNEAVEMGYSYFQGYYFSKPLLINANKIPENKRIYLKILKELNNKELSIENIENLIKKDISLSYKLLKLINSARYTFINSITSMKQAIALLGVTEIKKWLYVITIQSIGTCKPESLITDSLVRARLLELVAMKIGLKEKAFYAYLIGMLAKIDILLELPLDQILDELLVSLEVKEVLMGRDNSELAKLYSLVMAYEEADWENVEECLTKVKISEEELVEAYVAAIEWSNDE